MNENPESPSWEAEWEMPNEELKSYCKYCEKVTGDLIEEADMVYCEECDCYKGNFNELRENKKESENGNTKTK